MTKYTAVLASLLRHLSRSDFGKAVKERQADKGVRTLSIFDFFRMMVYGQLSGCCGLKSEVFGNMCLTGAMLIINPYIV
jgi:hypothetical protein